MNNNYKTYSIEDLASDEAFIRWVKGLDAEKEAEWNDWLVQNPGKKEDVEAARGLVEAVAFKSEGKSDIDKEELWNKIEKSTRNDGKPIAKKRKLSILKPAVWAAAATIAFFLIFKPFAGKETSVVANLGEHIQMQLPDQSTVTLNAGTEIGYFPKTWDKIREVKLDGEAFFDVKKGSRFTVETNLGKVEVLGTSFNVLSRGEEFKVFCKTGKVKVTSHSGRFETTLSPGNIATLTSNKNFEKSSVDDDKPINWTKGIFKFDGNRLEEVFEEFERQYNVEIISSPGIDTMRYTGSFITYELEKALYDITWPMDLKTQINGNKITVEK